MSVGRIEELAQDGLSNLWASAPLGLVGGLLVYKGLSKGVEVLFQNNRHQILPMYHGPQNGQVFDASEKEDCCGHNFSPRGRMLATAVTLTVIGGACLFGSYVTYMHGWAELYGALPSLKSVGNTFGEGLGKAICKKMPAFCTG